MSWKIKYKGRKNMKNNFWSLLLFTLMIVGTALGTFSIISCSGPSLKEFDEKAMGCRVYLSTVDGFLKLKHTDTILTKVWEGCKGYIDNDLEKARIETNLYQIKGCKKIFFGKDDVIKEDKRYFAFVGCVEENFKRKR